MPTFRDMRPLRRLKRWMYRGGRPSRLARLMNRSAALQFSAGVLSPRNWVTLQVRGRRTGRLISAPVVVADHAGERYLVAMLGENTNWVRNVRAADGRAALLRRGTEAVRLVEVPPAERAPILRRYLRLAPGARPHVPVDRRAPLAEFERIADRYPVFRITVDPPGPPIPPG
jgi:deazaflavin-dependent oxidoreductase (nitroreductase family)